MNQMFNGMFGKVANGMCRLSMNGGIAVKTSSGYKTYNLAKNRLVNCSNFVFNIGEEFFFVIPTNKVHRGDIIIANGTPKCVLAVETDTIKVVNYEDGTIENILPERHVFMGNTYFYGKIVSMFGTDIKAGGKGVNKIMSYMAMSEVLKGINGNGTTDNASNPFAAFAPFMMFNGGNFGNMFDGMFDFDIDDDDIDECEDIVEEEDKEE